LIKPRPERRPDPRSAVAAFLSFLFPGFGQAYNGQYLLAGLLAVPVLVTVVVLLLAVLGSGSFLSRLLDTRVLVALIVMDAALLGWRLVAIVQAHGERSRLSFSGWPTWLTGALVMVTLAMHVMPAYYATKAIDTLGSVALEGGGGLFDDREGRDIVISEPSNQPEVAAGERVTVLLVGIDYAPGRTTHLTDTMLVATLDSATGEGAMISVPRDLYGVPLPDGRVYNAKLNSLMVRASANPDEYPLGGPGTLKAAIGELLGTQIHYFAAIDLAGLRQVIDTVGGIDVVVDRTVNDPAFHDPFTNSTGFYLEAGAHHLDGSTALAYVRSRQGAGDSDFTRAARQQQVLTAIADKLTGGNIVVSLPGLLDAIRDNMATDIPSDRIPDLAAEGQDADLGALERVVLAPPDYVTPEPFSAAGYILHPDLEAIRDLGERVFGS
jgi:polyisoprenyl-teichoic acid--peptidoglycan teichoic acid transferase